jgi:DNA-binding winged helix-turn-helix (wHTH) protein/TolB-like protein/Tfp pilus assembly protein PilF
MDSQTAEKSCFTFGPYRLDKARRSLSRDGQPVKLTPRLFDTLAYLVENAGRVVGKDEILQAVWGGRIVEEANLSQAIFSLRRALPNSEPLISTAPGRGYQFVGDVVEIPFESWAAPEAPKVTLQPWRRPWLVAGLASAAVLLAAGGGLVWRSAPPAPRLSIAVLPFRNLSPDRMEDFTAEGISDDLRSDLAHIPASIVIARESVETFAGSRLSAPQIGQALKVRYLVSGDIRAAGAGIRIEVFLTDAAANTQITSLQRDVPKADVAWVRDLIVRQLAGALDFKLGEVESARSVHDRPDDPDAVDLFLRARALLARDDTLAGLQRAQALLEQAVDKQPDFADALAQLGAMLLHKMYDRDDPQDGPDFAEAQRVIKRALDLAPRNAEALAARARLLVVEGRWTDAAYSARIALDIEPSSVPALAVLATCEQVQGKLDEAAADLQAILRLQPETAANKLRFVSLGYIRLLQGRPAEAIGLMRQSLAGDSDPAPGTDSMGRAERARLGEAAGTAMLGDLAHARALYQQASAIWPHRTVWRVAAYFPKSMQTLPGFQNLLAALRAAGMPAMAAETDSVAPPGAGCVPGDFSPTPAALPPGGEILTTASFKTRRLQSPPPLVLDVWRGVAAPPGALWFSPGDVSDSAGAFADHALRTAQGGGIQRPVIVLGEGPAGCAAYETALHLLAEGYVHVAWYRGGEEAWAASGEPAEDRRQD